MGEGGYHQINKTLNADAFEGYLSTQQSVLPELKDVEQISPRVIRVLGQNAGKFTLQGTNTYIVGTGSTRLIIDTAQGFREWANLLSSELSASCITLSHVFLTHWHGDHTGGVPDLLQLYPHLSTAIYKNSPSGSQKPIVDGETFTVEGATIRAVHSPGHSNDHMCFILEEENAMFTGDNVLGHGSSAVEELGTYMSSLGKMQSFNCEVGYPAHGTVILNLPAKIAGELAQKVRREKQILQAFSNIKRKEIDSGRRGTASVTIKELVTAMHGETIDDGLREMVLEPFVTEVLRKLAKDGKAAFEMRAGVKRWFRVDIS